MITAKELIERKSNDVEKILKKIENLILRDKDILFDGKYVLFDVQNIDEFTIDKIKNHLSDCGYVFENDFIHIGASFEEQRMEHQNQAIKISLPKELLK